MHIYTTIKAESEKIYEYTFMDVEYAYSPTSILSDDVRHNVELVVLVLLLTVLAFRLRAKKSKAAAISKLYGSFKPPKIVPVAPDYCWNKAPMLKLYPFKDSEYKLTMGIKRIDPNDWMFVEPSYLKMIEEKKLLISNQHPNYEPGFDIASRSLFVTPDSEYAIRELYEMVVDFVCTRYPMHFKVNGNKIYNNITNDVIPAKADKLISAMQLLEYLVLTVEEDFILMMKDEDLTEEDEYKFKGGIFAFAAGFDPLDKFNCPLSDIHGPIPGYESKLKISMNRFFNRISPGQFVSRSNFSVQTHAKLFVSDDNKGYHNTGQEIKILKEEDLDFENLVFYRSERQVLTRLPKSGAVVFSIKTYLVPLPEVRAEGQEVSERLAGALDKFPEDIRNYKNVVAFGGAVSSYLRKWKDA